jgi:hypothetical protein
MTLAVAAADPPWACAQPRAGREARLAGGSGGGVPSLGPNWPVFSTDKYGQCWTCDRLFVSYSDLELVTDSLLSKPFL